MTLRQISIFIENKHGRLSAVVKNLADAGINIRALSLADTEKFGILRIIADQTDRANSALREAGVTSKISEVIGVEVPDRPGGLAELVSLFDNSPVNVEYMYAQVKGRNGKAVLIMKLSDPETGRDILTKSKMVIVSEKNFNE